MSKHLQLPAGALARLRTVQVLVGAPTLTDTVQWALATYDLLATTRHEGGRILLETADGQTRELCLTPEVPGGAPKGPPDLHLL